MKKTLRCSHSSFIILPSPFSSSFPRRSRRAGLTVLELVSSLALFIIILGALLVALNSATDIWTRSANRNRDQQKVRQALDLVATDLASAVAPRRFDATAAVASATPGTAQKPVFIAERNATQVGLYFIRMCSPVELADARQLSLNMVAYSWTTNGLSRYTRPVQDETGSRSAAPDLNQQLERFKSDVLITQPPSNILTSATVGFATLLYQPLRVTPPTANAAIPYIGQDDAAVFSEVKLDDLPDFVDILIAYADPEDWANGYGKTNYMTRRITLPAAQASRLP